jgi:hypothetical protein
MRKEAPTTKLRMTESRDYWRRRALTAERELAQAAKCVRAFLKTRKAAEDWLTLFDKAATSVNSE